MRFELTTLTHQRGDVVLNAFQQLAHPVRQLVQPLKQRRIWGLGLRVLRQGREGRKTQGKRKKYMSHGRNIWAQRSISKVTGKWSEAVSSASHKSLRRQQSGSSNGCQICHLGCRAARSGDTMM